MLEIRIHGRGGQGNVVAAYLLATAAFEDGRYCQAFPAFGAERRGAPVVAFVRIADEPVIQRNEVAHPAFLIIQDETLFHEPHLVAGLKPGGGILMNSAMPSKQASAHYGQKMVTLPAGAMAMKAVGRPLANVALLAAFLSLTQVLPQEALAKALAGRFSGDVLEKNLALAAAAAACVRPGLWLKAAGLWRKAGGLSREPAHA